MKSWLYLDIYKGGGVIIFEVDREEILKKSKDISELTWYIRHLQSKGVRCIIKDSDWNEIFKELLNKNPDWVSQKVLNYVILSTKRGIKNDSWERLSFLWKNRLEDIISGTHTKIHLDWEKLEKIKRIYNFLEKGYSKVTLTTIAGLKQEIEWFGSWTMFIDLDKAVFEKLKAKEFLYEMYKYHLKKWNWKERSMDELEEMADNYYVLSLEWTILGWYYLSDFEKEIDGELMWGRLLENLFASRNGGWIWFILWHEIKKEKKVFTYTKKGRFFKKLGFVKIAWSQSKSGADLYKYIKK